MLLALALSLGSCPGNCAQVYANPDDTTDLSADSAVSGLDPAAKSALLMEASTGTVIFEKNADERLRPASVTKIMTLLLIFEALEKNQFM